MQFSANGLGVQMTWQDCELPTEERARIQQWLTDLGNAVRDFPDTRLDLRIINHPQSEKYKVELRLMLPGRSLATGEEDPYLDSALQRGFRKLSRKVDAYKTEPDREAVAAAERRAKLSESIVAPEDPGTGPLGEAARAGDYRTFRTSLATYEEWLRKRVGRLIERHPEAQARVDAGDLPIGDVVEEVYLNAFERFTQRSTAVPLSDWLEGLIEPSIRALLRNPDEERAAASFARTVREAVP